MAIAQRLGYISVIEELRQVTQTTLVSTTIKTTEEKYKVQTPETMQETFMSDSEDEMGYYSLFIYLNETFIILIKKKNIFYSIYNYKNRKMF